ncbi:MAG: heparinase II/III-family protein, partial [Pseudomonadales bacterium]
DVPNVGANDGARIIPLTDTDYRDFRPSVQLATSVFHGAAAYSKAGEYDYTLTWLNVQKPARRRDVRGTRDYPEGGFVVMRRESVMLMLRYPVFRFRPSQSDLLHLDLWSQNINLLRDAGTYSYNSGDKFQDYFGSVQAHNTIQFDDRDQMPKLSRFLYGAWPKMRHKVTPHLQNGSDIFQVGYKDWLGAEHLREVRLSDASLMVVDTVSGFEKQAVLRWRLCPGEWKLRNNEVASVLARIVITADDKELSLRLVEGWESRYYSQKTPVLVLEATVRNSCKITSEIYFSL